MPSGGPALPSPVWPAPDAIASGAARRHRAGRGGRLQPPLLAVDTQANQRSFLTALGAFGRALDSTRKPFVALSAAEQDIVLTDASTMSSSVPPLVPWTTGPPVATGPAPAVASLTLRDHFELIKGWIADAYYSSEIGMRELGYTGNIFPTEFTGCTHPDGRR